MNSQARVFLSMLHETCDGVGPHDADGVAQGLWTFFASDGSRQAEGFLRDGEPHGTWRVWDAAGQLRSESEWHEGEPCGRWVTWTAEGELERVDVKGEARPAEVLVVLSSMSAAQTLPV
ncbi:MAG: hypothetical protein HYS27_01270 [Deltaproteobacteria bacterium]|nr:hypothetical protein [Deltaproteobacteria bacterium]